MKTSAISILIDGIIPYYKIAIIYNKHMYLSLLIYTMHGYIIS